MRIPAIAALFFLASCGPAAEQKLLIGTWRAERDWAVEEVAFRPDHTLVWWLCPAKTSPPPETYTWSARWRVRRNRIEMDIKPRGGFLAPPPGYEPGWHDTLEIVELTPDSLTTGPVAEEAEKQNDPHGVLKFRRLDIPSCRSTATDSSPTAVEQSIIGTWQVHYHTRDFRYHFAPDHTVSVSGLVSTEFQTLGKGSWSFAGGDLLMDLKPDSLEMDEPKPRWKLYGFQHDCFWIKDSEGIEYAVHRNE